MHQRGTFRARRSFSFKPTQEKIERKLFFFSDETKPNNREIEF
jgi:hypothetical protein